MSNALTPSVHPHICSVLLATVMCGGTGCPAPCEGAACGDLYPRGSLGLFRSADLVAEEIDALSPAYEVLGADADGFDWAVVGASGGVLVGVPAAEQVRWYDTNALAADGGPSAMLQGEGAGHRFGAAVAYGAGAGGGTRLVVGAPAHAAAPTIAAAGAVYVFEGVDATLSGAPSPHVVLGIEAEDHFGDGVWTCGDLDADGLADWAAAAPWSTANGQDLAGSLTLGLSTTPLPAVSSSADLPRLHGRSNGAHFGAAVSCTVTLDADASPDLVVTAPYTRSDANEGAGTVSIWTGPVDGASEPGLVLLGAEAGASFGASVAVGDLDGDGANELVVGAPGTDGGDDDDTAGAVFVYAAADVRAALADPTTLPTPAWTLRGEFARGRFGATVRVADLDGDGVNDLVVGTPGLNRTGEAAATRSGAAAIWWGPATAWSTVQFTSDAPSTVVADRQYLETGRVMATTDLDGDAVEELVLLTRAASEAD